MSPASLQDEWLESDGSGGYASGTVATLRTRRYHALLLVARAPPSDRVVLVNGFEAWVDAPSGTFPLSTQRYGPDVVHPRGIDFLTAFAHEPWPRWTFRGSDGIEIVHELIVDRQDGSVLLAWRLAHATPGVQLRVRPLLSGRDYHSLMHENAAFAFAARSVGGNVAWHTYADLPAVTALTNGSYVHEPLWYRNFDYAEEAARGLDHNEDLGAPGTFHFDLSLRDAVMVLRADDHLAVDAATAAAQVKERETRRRRLLAPLDRAAESFVVRGNLGRHDHRRLSMVRRLGPRHIHCHAWPAACREAATILPDRSCWRGRAPCHRACCPIAFPNTAARRSSIRWTRHCGS